MLPSLVRRSFVLLFFACARQVAAPPDLGAVSLPADAGSDAIDTGVKDPFFGNPPPPPIPREASVAKNAKCSDEKHEGWGSSGGGCGDTMKWRCDSTQYVVECSGGRDLQASCTCHENGRVVGRAMQPGERCGRATLAAESCGLPMP